MLREHEHAWRLETDRLPDALTLLDALSPIPEHLGRGLLVVGFQRVFHLRDPLIAGALPHQGADLYSQDAEPGRPLGASSIYLRLSSRSTCAVFLCFPFGELDAERDYAARLRAALPFQLSTAHWSRWRLNAGGTRYTKRRLS